MAAWRYEFYFLVAKTIFYSLAVLVRKILFCHSNIKFISLCHHVISSIYFQAEFVHAKVSPPLSLNATNCKHAREYVKELNATREKEILKRKALDKVKTKEPRNKGKIVSLHEAMVTYMVY